MSSISSPFEIGCIDDGRKGVKRGVFLRPLLLPGLIGSIRTSRRIRARVFF